MRGSPDLVLGLHGGRQARPQGTVGLLVAGALGVALSFLVGCGECDLAAYEAARHEARRAEMDAAMALADAEGHLRRGRLDLATESAAIESAVKAAAEEREGITARLLEDAGVVKAVGAYDDRIEAFQKDAGQAREAVGRSMRASGNLQDQAALLEKQSRCDDEDFSEAWKRGDSAMVFSRRVRNLADVKRPEPGLAVAQARITKLRREQEKLKKDEPVPAPGPSPAPQDPELERIDGYVIGRLYWFDGQVTAKAVVSEVPCTDPKAKSSAEAGTESLAGARKEADAEAVRTLAGDLPEQKIDVEILAKAECYEVVRVVYRSDSPARRAEVRRQVQDELAQMAAEGRPKGEPKP